MKQIILSIIFFLPALCFGQNTIKVVSDNNDKPIENVALFNTDRTKAVITDNSGYTGPVNFSNSDTIIIQHPSYYTKKLPYHEIYQLKTIRLTKKNILIDEFIISASKSRESRQFLPYSVNLMQKTFLQNDVGQSAADILMSTGNILVQKSQAGGGSPILRGFEANKILLVVDGVRMNNAIYRNGHLQNSITIDNSILERTEVIFGPGSLIYGSDALGGVIHYFTQAPELSNNEETLFKGSAYTQYSTANQGKIGHLHFNIGRKKLGSLTSVSYKYLGDIKTGKNRNLFYGDWGKVFHYAERVNGADSMINNPDPLTQPNTGYSQIDILQKFKYAQSQFIDWYVNLQYSTSSDIDRFDMLNDYSGNYLKYAEYYYGPQSRLLASIKNENRNDNTLFSNSTSVFAYQRINEDRISRKFNNSNKLYQMETLNILSLNIDFLKIWNKNNRLNYGYDLIYNNVASNAHYHNIDTDELTLAQTRYPEGGSNTFSSSIYASYKRIINNKLIFNGGFRYNLNFMRSLFSNEQLPFDTINIFNGAITGSASLVYHPTKEWQINAILSTGYRNPNVDDYGKIRAKNNYILVPNPDINPEYTYNAEIGLSRNIEEVLRIDVAAFYTLLTNAIVRTDYELNGLDSMMYDGDIYKISANYNANLAHIYGTTVNFFSNFDNYFTMKASLNITHGHNISDDAPLGHIPPVFGRVSLTYDNKRFRFDSYVYYNGWKYADDFSPYGEDNDDEALYPRGFPNWWTLNLNSSYILADHLTIGLSIENILDQFYKPYASGVSSAGRNFILTVRTNF